MAFKNKLKINGSHRQRLNKKDLIFYCLILAIPLTQLAIFYFGVNFQSFFMAFQEYDAVKNVYIWDMTKNLSKFITNVKQLGFWIQIKNSLLIWGFSTIVGTSSAVLFSYYIYKRRTLCNVFKFVLFLPSVLPGILLIAMFKTFMVEALPAIGKLLTGTEWQNVFQNDDLRFWVITIYSIWIGFGSQVLIYTGAMDKISPEIIEAGQIDGVTPFREFISIIVPSIIPTISTLLIAGVTTIFTNQNNLLSFSEYGIADPDDMTIGYQLYQLVYSDGNGKSGYCYAAFLGMVCTFIALPLVYAVRKILNKVAE